MRTVNPALKKALYGLLAALALAAAAYFQTGCTAAQVAKVESAADKAEVQALCAKAALELHDDALVEPDLNSVKEAADLAKALRDCFRKPPAPAASDAGAN